MQQVAIVDSLRSMDGAILAGQLLEKDLKVIGCIRRSSRGQDLRDATPLQNHPNLEVAEIDLLDQGSLHRLQKLTRPYMWYHVAAQSHVGTSFEQPILTLETNTLGTLNCLEAIRDSGIHTRFLNCSTSEMYGNIGKPANEETPFHPRSTYGVSKVAAHYAVQNYRESYRFFACSSICFNHEHQFRGPNFVTRKITLGLADILSGKSKKLVLGNLDARRDWGWAPEFCQGMYLMLTAHEPKDYVFATGETHSVREFCEEAFSLRGLNYKDYVEVSPLFYRPAEVDVLIGDYSLARQELGWYPQVTFKELVKRMVNYDCPEVHDGTNS